MTFITGIGDEVVQIFVFLAIILIILVAWWSTNISERPLMRTVLILERRTRHTPIDSSTIDNLTDLRDSTELSAEANPCETEGKTSHPNNDNSNQITLNNAVESSDNEIRTSENCENLENDSHDNAVATMNEESEDVKDSSNKEPESLCPDPDINSLESEGIVSCNKTEESEVVRHRRLAFFNNKEECYDIPQQNLSLKKLIDESSAPQEESNSSNEENIRIRLKYLNDDQKLVEGNLQEPLGDFKRRHFSLELSGRKLVRLIFNGQVLQQESRTLQNYGFFDNCVVHCLVHQPRTPPPSPNLNRTSESQAQSDSNHNHWDLGNILFASLSFLLGLAWYGRYQYAQLYTATTTIALIGLTAMFTVSLIGMYTPDASVPSH